MAPPEITNLNTVRPRWREEVLGAAERAVSAGATEALSFVGIGMYGVVFCDDNDVAWKVFRRAPESTADHLLFLRTIGADEFGFLKGAEGSLASRFVAGAYDFHPDEIVLERECVQGSPGTPGDSAELHKTFHKIAQAMEPRGWGAPEYKEDSFIFDESGVPKLVDAGFANRIGMNLADYVAAILEGHLEAHYKPRDLAFFVIREFQEKAIPEDVARSLLRELIALDPEIRKGFLTPRELGL